MGFTDHLSDAIGRRGAVRIALFFGWFALICTALALLFSSFVAAAWSQIGTGFGSTVLMAVLALAMWFGAACFWLVVLAAAIGKVRVVAGPQPPDASVGFAVVETRSIALWRFALLREFHGHWQTLPRVVPPALAADAVWSWVGFDHLDDADALGPAEVVTAAVWWLVARDAVQLRVRPEARHWLGGLWRSKGRPVVHAVRSATPLPAPTGAWEARLLDTIEAHARAAPFTLSEWVTLAFGDTVAQPMRDVKTIAVAGRPRAAALPPASNADAWRSIAAFAKAHATSAHATDALVFGTVRAALNARVDAS